VQGSTEQWRTVFWIAAAVYLVGNVLFLVLGDGVVQPWNDPNFNSETAQNVKRSAPSVE